MTAMQSVEENGMAKTMTASGGSVRSGGERSSGKAGAGLEALQVTALRLVLPTIILIVWSMASRSSPGVADVLPPPERVLAALWELTLTGQLPAHLAASLGRALAGFAVATVIGVTIGFVMSQSRTLGQILAGPVELLRPISSIAWIPLAILWFGIGFTSVVFVIVVSCVFIILLNTIAAGQVDRDLTRAALTLGANRRQLFFKVVVPNAVPGIMLGLRIAMTGAWGGVLVAEMIATQTGIGYMIVRAQASYQPAIVIGGMLVVGVVGYLLNTLFLVLQRKISHG